MTFTPTQHHPQGYVQKVLFKVSSTKMTPFVTLTGSSVIPKLAVEPQHLDLGALMPGQPALRGSFTISNMSDCPVEVRFPNPPPSFSHQPQNTVRSTALSNSRLPSCVFARTHYYTLARVHTHTQSHTRTHTHAGTRTHTNTHACTHAYSHAHTCQDDSSRHAEGCYRLEHHHTAVPVAT